MLPVPPSLLALSISPIKFVYMAAISSVPSALTYLLLLLIDVYAFVVKCGLDEVIEEEAEEAEEAVEEDAKVVAVEEEEQQEEEAENDVEIME